MVMRCLFQRGCRLAPLIPDYAELGAYSKSLTAKTYKQAAQRMPRLILMSVFGDSELAKNMAYFLEHLEQAEHTLAEKDLELLENVMFKDRGPLLYWLINERASPSHLFLSFVYASALAAFCTSN